MTAYHVIQAEDADAVARFARLVLDDHVVAVEVRRVHDCAEADGGC